MEYGPECSEEYGSQVFVECVDSTPLLKDDDGIARQNLLTATLLGYLEWAKLKGFRQVNLHPTPSQSLSLCLSSVVSNDCVSARQRCVRLSSVCLAGVSDRKPVRVCVAGDTHSARGGRRQALHLCLPRPQRAHAHSLALDDLVPTSLAQGHEARCGALLSNLDAASMATIRPSAGPERECQLWRQDTYTYKYCWLEEQ